ncbi:MAG: RbsD or FucU transport [Streptomycetaceae bacterium]|nr:RbsD or FucU transport [Streptomycetaceae bacterium]
MLKYRLIHPPLLAVLAAAGHGSRILLADANFAHSTNARPEAARVFLNLRPGLLTVDQVLECIADACPIESASSMRPDDGSESAAVAGYARFLGDGVGIAALDRLKFYEACRSPEVAAVVATGDQRHFANILLTLGAVPPPADPR